MPVLNRIIQMHRLYVVASLAGAMLLFAGCASSPIAPTASLNDAKVAIQAAENDGASQHAAAELDAARQKLILADKAVVAENMLSALRFADESTVTAKLAAARTEATKAVAINQEMSRGADALTEEVMAYIRKQIGLDYPWPGNVRELEQCVRNVLVRGEYIPRQAPLVSYDERLAREIAAGSITIDELLRRYCTLAYLRAGSYEEAARRLQVDRRTIKARVDLELLDRLRRPPSL